MNIAILDDYFDTLQKLPSFNKLGGHDVDVWTDHTDDVDVLVDWLAGVDVLVLFRERTAIGGPLLDRLPDLRFISMRGDYPHVDVAACARNGVVLSSNMGRGGASHPTAELTWALILASMRQIPEQMASLRRGDWQIGVGRSLHGRTLGLFGYGRIAKTVAGYAEAFGMPVQWWASEEGRARAEANGATIAANRRAFFY